MRFSIIGHNYSRILTEKADQFYLTNHQKNIYVSKKNPIQSENAISVNQLHTAGLDTIFIQIYMDAPPGVPGVSKELEGHKDQYLDVFLR